MSELEIKAGDDRELRAVAVDLAIKACNGYKSHYYNRQVENILEAASSIEKFIQDGKK